jgi:hypothetical protein
LFWIFSGNSRIILLFYLVRALAQLSNSLQITPSSHHRYLAHAKFIISSLIRSALHTDNLEQIKVGSSPGTDSRKIDTRRCSLLDFSQTLHIPDNPALLHSVSYLWRCATISRDTCAAITDRRQLCCSACLCAKVGQCSQHSSHEMADFNTVVRDASTVHCLLYTLSCSVSPLFKFVCATIQMYHPPIAYHPVIRMQGWLNALNNDSLSDLHLGLPSRLTLSPSQADGAGSVHPTHSHSSATVQEIRH